MSSEEETWSKLSELIFYNNWKGIYSQLLPFAQLSKNGTLLASINNTFADAYKCLPNVVTKDTWSKVSISACLATASESPNISGLLLSHICSSLLAEACPLSARVHRLIRHMRSTSFVSHAVNTLT